MVYLHTGPMGVHRACFFIARAGRAATPERNRSGNQPPILCILPLVAHQLASARQFFPFRGVTPVVLAGPPAVGVRLPAEVCGVSEPDRAVVEGIAVAGVEGSAVRDLGGGLPRRRGGDGLLEPASAPVPLGPAASAPAEATAGDRGSPRRQGTYRMNHLGPKQARYDD